MKIDILDIAKTIDLQKLPEISNPVYFHMGNIPTSDGLFSNEIFGYPGSTERKTRFAYINLKKPFLHPIMYKLLTSMDKKILDLVEARRYFIVQNKELVEDKDGKTGVGYLYEIFDQLEFKDTGTSRRSNYLSLLSKLKKDDIFTKRFLVIPPFYRDFKPAKDSNERVTTVDEINDLYVKLIRLSNSISEKDEYDFMGAVTEASMQKLVFEIYDYFTSALAGKNGLLHKDLLGKSIDYATRSVISAPRLNTNTWDENPIRFGYTGIPLSQISVLFYPFFVKFIQEFALEHENEMSEFIDEKTKKKVTVKNVMEQFSQDKIKAMINLYIKSAESRFNSITIKADDGNHYPVPIFREDLKRNFTITDLLYICAKDVIEDKHVYLTRYPIEQYRAKRSPISI